MSGGGVGGLGSVTTHVTTQPQDAQQTGEIKPKGFGKVTAFFSSMFGSIKDAFKSFGESVSALVSHGADAAAAKSTKGVYSSSEKRAMLADLRQSDMYKAVKEGDSLTKANLETGAEKILSNPKALQAMKDHGLTFTEAVGIFIYTSGDYSNINSQLRDRDRPSADVSAVSAQIISGMGKLPPHDATVTRLVNLPTRIADQHAEGAVIEYDGYTSTSMKQHGDENFTGNVFMIIEPKGGSAGKDVSMFSNVPHEEEVLFPPGTRFQVTERTEPKESQPYMMGMQDRNAGKINVVMQEV